MFTSTKRTSCLLFLTIILITSTFQPIISPISVPGDLLTSSSYEYFVRDQFNGNQAWELVNTLANSTFEGRLTATTGQHLAANYIAEQFVEVGLLPAGDLVGTKGVTRSYFQNFTLNAEDGRGWTSGSTENVLGWIPGKNDEVVIISAHYDHFGVWDETSPFSGGTGLYAGADDNASGVAVLLELVRILQEYIVFYGAPSRSILFACWSGEEEGLHGSRYYFQHPTIAAVKDIVLNINFDMVGGLRTENFGFEIEGGTEFPDLYAHFEMASKLSGIPVHNTSIGRRSDHYSAYAAGIPAVLLFWDSMDQIHRSHPDYHTPQDTPDKTDPSNLRDAGILAGLVLQSYCFVDLVDTTPPVVLNTTYSALDVGIITFISRVVDNLAVETVTFHYSQDGGASWLSKPMAQSSPEYTTSLEPSQEGIWILFYVSASDTTANMVRTPSSEILVDTIPPLVSNVQHNPNHPTDSDMIVVTAQVEDNLAIASVVLQYSTDGGITWEFVPMQLIEGVYLAEIGTFQVETNVTYYVSAIDIGGNSIDQETLEMKHFRVRDTSLIEFNGVLIIVFTSLIFGLLLFLVWRNSKRAKKS